MNNVNYATRFFFSTVMGWYLMIPPPGDPYNKHPPLNLLAPLFTWKQIDSYDSAKKCKSDFGTKVYLSQVQLAADTKQSSKRTDRVF